MEQPIEIKATPIINYLDKETLLKMRNLSAKARELVFSGLKGRTVRVKEQSDPRAALINGNFIETYSCSFIGNPDSLIKGKADYVVDGEETKNTLKKTFNELNCNLSLFSKIEETHFNQINKVAVKKRNVEFFGNLTFDRIRCLQIDSIDSETTAKLIASTKKIDHLVLSSVKLNSSSFSGAGTIGSVVMTYCKFEEEVKLPKIRSLKVQSSEQIERLICPELVELDAGEVEGEVEQWISGMKRLKVLKLFYDNCILPISCINSGLREVSLNGEKAHKVNLTEFTKKCPYLISLDCLNGKMPLSAMGNLRHVDVEVENDCETEVSARWRKVAVDDTNADLIRKHPELTSKSTDWTALCEGFDFDLLPGRIDNISFYKTGFISRLLSRFGK